MSKSSLARTLAVLIILLLVLIYEAATQFEDILPEATAPPAVETAPLSGRWYTVLFSNPLSPGAEAYRGGPDESLAAAIAQARLSVDVAAYQFNSPRLFQSLLDAHRRGVTVRLVTDSDYLDEEEVEDLIAAGVPVLGDRREGLMHNKFLVIDRREVCSGSMNLTSNGIYRNDNNLICLQSARLAQNYLREFEEMFVADQFGPRSPSDTPYPMVSIDGTLIEVYFSPEDHVADQLVRLIETADESLYFLAYSFTADDLAAAMVARAEEGVTVAGVFEQSQYLANVGTEYEYLRSAEVDVRLDGNPRSMHHKVILIDREVVVTGSYNFSASAEERNDENLLVIHSPEIAEIYLQEFQRVFAAAQEE